MKHTTVLNITADSLLLSLALSRLLIVLKNDWSVASKDLLPPFILVFRTSASQLIPALLYAVYVFTFSVVHIRIR